MARWMLNIDGGPKRVNHAAVAIGDKVKISGVFPILINPIQIQIYSFGGYTASEVGFSSDFIDVHCLNTFTYRWQRLPVLPIDTEEKKSRRSATISGPGPDEPSTSQSSRRRAHSLNVDFHPLLQIRVSNPPIYEDDDEFEEGIQSPRPEEPPININDQQNSPHIENAQSNEFDISIEERQEREHYREVF